MKAKIEETGARVIDKSKFRKLFWIGTKNAIQFGKQINEKQNEIQDIWTPKQKHRRSLAREIDDLAVNIDALDREIIDIQQDTELKQKKIPLLKEEISNLLTTATDMEVEIQE